MIGFRSKFGVVDNFGFGSVFGISFPPFKSDLLHYSKTDGQDKLGTERASVMSKKVVGNGVLKAEFTNYPNQSLTYLNATTLTVESGITDASAEWIIPTNGVLYVIIDGYWYVFEENVDQLDNNQARFNPSNDDGSTEMIMFNTYDGWCVPSVQGATNDSDTTAQCNKYGCSFAIKNELSNYDFSDGINSWNVANSVNSELNQILTNVGNGTSRFPNTRQAVLTAIENDVWFVFCRARVDNAECTSIQIGNFTGEQYAEVNNPTPNQWYDIYGVKTGYTTNLLFLVHTYADPATANGKAMEIDGNMSNGGGVFTLNLTAIDEALGTDYTTWTAEDINDIKYDLLSMQIYRDTNGTVRYETGQPISALRNADGSFSMQYCKGYLANGDRAPLYYVGVISRDFDVTATTVKWSDNYPIAQNLDASDVFVDDNTLDEPTNKVVLVSDLGPENPPTAPYVFTSKDNGEIKKLLVYDNVRTIDEREKIGNSLGNLTTLDTSEGTLSVSEGTLRVLK